MSSVKLYIYDLSNGMARQLSLQLTGRQIDGIWHTSVVVFDKEIFYGQGICTTTQPGKSHHGKPLRIVEMGETAIDQDTFEEYLGQMREHYTADKYHLLDFNCNSFTNDCIGFLTGGSLPSYITSLPSDFLSTPFGQALQPTIDAMFSSRPANGAAPTRVAPPSAAPNPALAASLLQAVAAQATMGGPSFGGAPSLPAPTPASAPTRATMPTATRGTPAPDAPITAPMHITTNLPSFRSLLTSHRVLVAFFTSTTCGPCRMIEPVFEDLAKTKSRANGVAFAKIDLNVGLGGSVASEYQVRVTPTFLFFLDGRKMHELKGVNAPELKTQVDLLVYQAFPPHAHMSLSLPAIEAMSLKPILFTQVPNLDVISGKLIGFIDGVPSWSGVVTQAQVKQMLSKTVVPFLKTSTATKPAQQPKSTNFDHWVALASSLTGNLEASQLFPLVDIWRLALLNGSFAAWSASKKPSEGGLQGFVDKAVGSEVPRNYLLTVVRMLCNAFSNEVLGRDMILFGRERMTEVLVNALLHEDALVRTAAASFAFNIAAHLQRKRVEKARMGSDERSEEENEEWEVEMVVAVLGAIDAEKSNEETVHRLVASLGLLLRLSPYTDGLGPLLESLDAGPVVRGKLEKGGCGASGVTKTEVRGLIVEVAGKLVPVGLSRGQ